MLMPKALWSNGPLTPQPNTRLLLLYCVYAAQWHVELGCMGDYELFNETFAADKGIFPPCLVEGKVGNNKRGSKCQVKYCHLA